ncbi:MAG: hypothetical protein LBT83_08990 [Tannerella sp.]|jgi:hypothetical protein|nr:hypothetical protein [Tannerella sp.]
MTNRRDILNQSSMVVAGGLLGTGILSTYACAQNEIALSIDAGVASEMKRLK